MKLSDGNTLTWSLPLLRFSSSSNVGTQLSATNGCDMGATKLKFSSYTFSGVGAGAGVGDGAGAGAGAGAGDGAGAGAGDGAGAGVGAAQASKLRTNNNTRGISKIFLFIENLLHLNLGLLYINLLLKAITSILWLQVTYLTL